MSAAKDIKKEQIDLIKSKISTAKSLVLVEYRGINVEQDTALRANCRKAKVDYHVYKNRLIKIAFNQLGFTEFDSQLENNTAVAISYTDALDSAKVISTALETIKCLSIKSGLCEGKFVNASVVASLAKIPSKEILLAQLCGLLQSGLSGMARALSQIAEKRANN